MDKNHEQEGMNITREKAGKAFSLVHTIIQITEQAIKCISFVVVLEKGSDSGCAEIV